MPPAGGKRKRPRAPSHGTVAPASPAGAGASGPAQPPGGSRREKDEAATAVVAVRTILPYTTFALGPPVSPCDGFKLTVATPGAHPAPDGYLRRHSRIRPLLSSPGPSDFVAIRMHRHSFLSTMHFYPWGPRGPLCHLRITILPYIYISPSPWGPQFLSPTPSSLANPQARSPLTGTGTDIVTRLAPPPPPPSCSYVKHRLCPRFRPAILIA